MHKYSTRLKVHLRVNTLPHFQCWCSFVTAETIGRGRGSGQRIRNSALQHATGAVPSTKRSASRIAGRNMQQINRRYHRLGHTLNGGPSQRCIVESESERIHGGNITRQRTRRISEYIKGLRCGRVRAPSRLDRVRPPEHKSKDPSEASLGSCTHVYRTGAWGRGA